MSLRDARKGRPIYKLTKSHTTRSGTLYDANTLVWVHEWFVDGSGAKVSKLNKATSLPMNTTFSVPTTKLEAYND